MTATVFRLNTAGSTNLTKVREGTTKVKGIIAVNTAAYAIFVKFYWFRPTSSAAAPTVGTTAPQITLELPALGTTTGGVQFQSDDGMVGGDAELWIAVTKLPADSDTTAVLAGDGLISLLVDP